jgi:peptidyl-prolyl cis-trans isomerase A (cyclophilin A)
MTTRAALIMTVLMGSCLLAARAENDVTVHPTAVIKTSVGSITVELWPEVAAVTVTNFQKYAASGFYTDTIFHRVMRGFMIQGGGFEKNLKQKSPRSPIKNEASPTAKNLRGTIAMARTMQVDSATSQFYINHADNPPLDQRDTSPGGFGYCVFGKVTDGMEVVDAIAALPTMARGMFQNLPRRPIVIEAVTLQVATSNAVPSSAAAPVSPAP